MTETAMIMQTHHNALLSQVVETYIDLKSSVSWSERTTKNNTSTLRCFVVEVQKIIGREPFTSDLNDLTVSKAINARWPNTGKSTTHHGITSRIKSFILWLSPNNYLTGGLELFREVKPIYPEVQVQFLRKEKAELAFRAAYAYSPRDAWMIWIGYKLARRVGELKAMRWRDLRLTPTPDAPYGAYSYPKIKPKGGMITVRLTASEREAIDGWLADYERLVGIKPHSDWYVFPATVSTGNSVKGQKRQRRLNPTQMISDTSPIWRTAYEEAGIYEKGFNSHGGRRGNLTDELYDLEAAGIPDAMLHVQRKAGHKERRTTARYIRQEEGERQSFEVRMKIDDIRSGKQPAPAAPTLQPEEQDERQSTTHTGESGGTVIHVRFGNRAG